MAMVQAFPAVAFDKPYSVADNAVDSSDVNAVRSYQLHVLLNAVVLHFPSPCISPRVCRAMASWSSISALSIWILVMNGSLLNSIDRCTDEKPAGRITAGRS